MKKIKNDDSWPKDARLYFTAEEKRLFEAIVQLSEDEERSFNKTCKLAIKKGLASVGYF